MLRDVPAGVLALQRRGALLLQRPLWLTGAPVALTTVAGAPHFEGALTLLHGPERIASGWWAPCDDTTYTAGGGLILNSAYYRNLR